MIEIVVVRLAVLEFDFGFGGEAVDGADIGDAGVCEEAILDLSLQHPKRDVLQFVVPPNCTTSAHPLLVDVEDSTSGFLGGGGDDGRGFYESPSCSFTNNSTGQV